MRPPDPYPEKSLSERDIQAYVDGAADPYQVDQIHDYLGQAPDEARRVAFYRRLNAQLQAGYSDPADTPQANALRRSVRSGRRRQRLQRIGTGLLALVLVLIVVARNVRPIDVLTPIGIMVLEEAQSGGGICKNGLAHCPASAQVLDLSRVGFHAMQSTRVSVAGLLSVPATLYRNMDGVPAVMISVPNWRLRRQPEWQALRVGTLRVLNWTHDGRFYILVAQGNTRSLMKAADLASSGIVGAY
jgi:anti-sigma factor RsiW